MARSSLNLVLLLVSALFVSGGSGLASESDRLILAHYMPWFASREISGGWGGHWTMGHFNPDRFLWEGERQVASQDYPLLGAYDSGDSRLLETQVLLMKMSGIQGVIVDWYGVKDLKDYAMVHRNTQLLIPILKRAGLKFAICYEDQSLGDVDGVGVSASKRIQEGALEALQWVDQNWFSDDSYVRLSGRPVLLVFGPQRVTGEGWDALRVGLRSNPLIFGLPHLEKQSRMDGVFGWVPVADGKSVAPEQWRSELARLYGTGGSSTNRMAVVFPSFQDMYQKAGLHGSYGRIDSREGKTFSETLGLALKSGLPLVQIATWNDHGEGTGIEPTRANGFRYLEILQAQLRPSGLEGVPFGVNDFRLPVALYELRRRSQNVPGSVTQLDQAAALLFAGKCRDAEAVLENVGSVISRQAALFAEGAEAPDPNYRLASDMLYRSGDGASDAMQQRCRLDVYYPVNRKAFSTVIWFHGGGLSKGERSIPLPLRNKDVAVVSINYRLAPGVQSPVYLEDAAAAIAWTFANIGKYGGSADSIFLSGHSAGAYLSTMAALDPKWLAAHGIPTSRIAGLIPFSSQMITHFVVREERGYDKNQAVVDDMAPLFHIRKNSPPMLLLTGDREQELYGRYEENAYFYRMAKLAGHEDVALCELQGFDHAKMPEPGFPLLLRFMEAHSGNAALNRSGDSVFLDF